MRKTMKIKILIKTMISCVILFFAAQVCAESISPPQQTIINVYSELRQSLKDNEAAIKADPKLELFKIVKKVVLPYVDVDQMIRVVLGRAGHAEWLQASKEKQAEFIDQFIILVVGTYSAALQQYDNQPVHVFPVRGFQPDDTTAEVHSVLVRDNGQEIQLLYNLQKEANEWKTTDFSVEGISLIQSYQEQFQSIIQSDGLTGLINALKKHNKANGND